MAEIAAQSLGSAFGMAGIYLDEKGSMHSVRTSRLMSLDAAAFDKPVGRLGLASHGATDITPDDVLDAVERGVGFLNWPCEAEGPDSRDAFSDAIALLGKTRDEVVYAHSLALDVTRGTFYFSASAVPLLGESVFVSSCLYAAGVCCSRPTGAPRT